MAGVKQIERKVVGDLDGIYRNYNADVVCKEITAFVKSSGNLDTGRVVNKFYNVELCTCSVGFYLIITSGTIGSMKQDVKVEPYSSMVYLREHYNAWQAKLKKNGFNEIDVLTLDNNTCSRYAQNFIEECRLNMTKSEAQTIIANSNAVMPQVKANAPVLDKHVVNFVNAIYKEADMLVKEYLDASKLQGTGSIGTISKSSIDEGRQLLSEILVEQNKLAVEKDASTRNGLMQRIATLSNVYNSKIPRVLKQKGKNAWCLTTGDLVVAQFEFLDTLELMLANALMGGNTEGVSAEQRYKALNTDITYVTDKKVINQIQKKLKTEQMVGHNFKTRLLNVFEINQHNAPVFDDSCGNVVSLFHGTGAANLFGILSTHLKVPAKTGSNIHITGRMFGDGVYFGQYSKALQYSTRRFGGSRNKGNTYFLLICEVALGKINMETNGHHFTTAPKGYHSVMGVGQDMKYGDCEILGVGDVKDFKLTKASVLKQIGHSALVLIHNEFIVYNQQRFRIKYIIEVEEA